MRRSFLVQLRNADGNTVLYPMKEWLRQNPDFLPKGFDVTGATSHAVQAALKRDGWRAVELKTEVHLIPPKNTPIDADTAFTAVRGETRRRQHRKTTQIVAHDPQGICFVIQPFDNGRFDKRYEDTIRPAIEAAGLQPYRVDEDPASTIPIENIEHGIRNADACFAEITTDNPNVWFELGFAIAANKPVIMACAEERTRFPFDVQHRTIIKYQSESARDFQQLGEHITKRLKAAMEAHSRVESLEERSPTASTEGLTPHEQVALISAAVFSFDGEIITSQMLRAEMERAGYTSIACALAIRGLEKQQYIRRVNTFRGHDEISGYVVTDSGLDWLDRNHEKLKLREFSRTDQ